MIKNIAIIFIFSLVLSCGGDDSVHIDLPEEGEEAISEDEVSQLGGSEEVINFGTTPWETPDKMKKLYRPFIRHLSLKLGKRVRFIVEQDYEALKNDLSSNLIQIAAFSPGAFADVLDKNRNSMIYVASMQKDGAEAYRGLIVVKKDSPYQSLKDIKGKKMGFVDPSSSSGYRYPVALLLQQGIYPEKYFSNVFFLGNHANVTDALMQGTIDVGATYDANLENAQKKHNDGLRILLKTEPIPYDAIVVSRQVGMELAGKLANVLVQINNNTKDEKGQYVMGSEHELIPFSGFKIKSPEFYDVVRTTSSIVRNYEQSKKK
jgi:phosphonate transport system substrate-binding protein